MQMHRLFVWGGWDTNLEKNRRVYDPEYLSPTLVAQSGGGTEVKISVQCVGNCNPSGNGMNGNVFDSDGLSPTLTTNKGEGLKITEPRVIGGVSEKNFGNQYRQGNRIYDSETVACALNAQPVGNAGGYSYLYAIKEEPIIGAIRGRNPDNPSDRTAGIQTTHPIGRQESRQPNGWRLVAQ